MSLRVDWRASCGLLGRVLAWLAVPLVAPLLAAVYYAEPAEPYLLAAAVALGGGLALRRVGTDEPLGAREAYLLVSLAWLAVAGVSAVPYVVLAQGAVGTPLNAMFEAMSGVTTTGATVMVDIEAYPRSLLLWRALTQWLGGLGILVLATAVLARLSVAGAQLMETESQLDDVHRLTPRIVDTARLVWGLYGALTVATVLGLVGLGAAGLAPEMTVYDAVTHALTSISTSGFSPRAESVGAFSPAVQWFLTLVMFVGATNFVLLYHLLIAGDVDRLAGSEEFRFYAGLAVGASGLVLVVLLFTPGTALSESLVRDATFQVVSILTTTGYASVDYTAWPAAAKHLLFGLMFVGGMAGSTTCSVKALRWLVVLKAFRRDLFVTVHPDAVRPVRLSGQAVDESAVRDVYAYTLVVLVLFFVTTVLVVTDAARAGLPLTEFEAMGAAASTLLNIGPAFGVAGPFASYRPFPRPTRAMFVVTMWVGRLELVPVLVLLTPSYWRS